jgi:hypothetical protein
MMVRYFPESQRFWFLPGVLAGWNTNEDFPFKVKGIDSLKLRASYGQMGNDQVTLTVMVTGSDPRPYRNMFSYLPTVSQIIYQRSRGKHASGANFSKL